MSDYINIEQFRIILKHEFITNNGIQQMEDPIVIACTMPKFGDSSLLNDRPYILNEMMEKLKFELLERASK